MTIRVTGHFGEWMQGRLGPDGPIVLVTIPCAALHVDAKRRGDGPLAFTQTPDLLKVEMAKAFLDRIIGQEAHYRLHANMPLGGGAGASTAALLALARAAGGDEAKLIDACIATEGASDPLMLPHPDRVLWASREGRVIRKIPILPRAEIIGGFWGAPTATDPKDRDFPDISDLVDRVIPGLSLQDLAEIASASARRCSALRGPSNDPTEALALSLGALGWCRAHTGSARGLIFEPGTVPDHAERSLLDAGLRQVLRFTTDGPSP
jgi:uncharacterized protein involved in propanediol utilization